MAATAATAATAGFIAPGMAGSERPSPGYPIGLNGQFTGYVNPYFGIGLTPLGVQSAIAETAIIRGSGGYRPGYRVVAPGRGAGSVRRLPALTPTSPRAGLQPGAARATVRASGPSTAPRPLPVKGRPMRRSAALALASALVFPGLAASGAAEPTPLAGVRRVVFLGDSITYSGQYVEFVEAFLRLNDPALRCEFLDLGLPSETVSGLSEPGHAGGQLPPPRPARAARPGAGSRPGPTWSSPATG